MCLTIRVPLGKNVEDFKKIANNNIICYKRLMAKKWKNQHGSGIKLTSPFKNFPYEIGYHYYQEGDEKFRIEKDHFLSLSNSNSWDIHDGLHSYNNLNCAINLKNLDEVIVECTIPQGSEYFEGTFGDLVSDQLIINKIIT
jgi:hypothetical protein